VPIEAGQTILHYRIVEKLGEGGMGVVWKAVDTTLDREVAIKVLPDAFAADAERLARFEQEARLLASLNHSSIAAVFSVHEHEGARFLAMEFVEGEDLAHRLARGRIPVDEALQIARQVAEALETAHDSGVIHRDLKPANIQLTPAGKIKVLDFGLAKALATATASGDPSLSPTMTSAKTMAGMILGTAGYMSPEQARGREVDRRADVWAFGCVLYEMLAGRRTFEGETVSDTLASVLKVDPDWNALPTGTPRAVRRLLRRCLTRDADRRLAHISGARLSLQETLDGVEPEDAPAGPVATAAPTRGWRRALPWALAGLFALIAAGFAWQASRDEAVETELLTLEASFPDELSLPSDQMGILALSPDGKTLALALNSDETKLLHIRRLSSAVFTPLPGTENASSPFFSPDGEWIGFFDDHKLKKVSVNGGNPVTLCDASGSNRGASWGTDDRIVFTGHYTDALQQVGGSGGVPTPLTTLNTERGERTHRWPQAVPGHDVVLFTVGSMDSPESYDGSAIDAVRPSSGERRTVLEGASMARYLPSGHLVFAREGFIFAVGFDIERLETRGSPVPVVEDVMCMRSSGISSNGLLAYISGTQRSRQSRLAWKYRDGRSEPIPAAVAGYLNPRFSPDRTQLLMGVEGDTTFDVWAYHLERETLTRLTFEGDNTWPVWSPDGRRIAFASVRNNALMSTYVKAANGSGEAELLFSPRPNWGQTTPVSWSPDGRFLFIEFTNENSGNIMALSLDGGDEQVLLESPADERNPSVSPDGRWLAYASNESGRFEVYVRPFPESGGKWQVSVEGGTSPRWSPDGMELYFAQGDRISVVQVDTLGGGFRTGRPQTVVEVPVTMTAESINYDILDKERLVLVEPAGDESAPKSVTVVVNWLDELRHRVPN